MGHQRSCIILIWIFCLLPVAYAAEVPKEVISMFQSETKVVPLTLEEALKAAMLNNFDVQLARYDRAISDTALYNALSIYDTVLSLDARYTHDELEKVTTLAGGVTEDYEIGINIAKNLPTGTDVELDYGFIRERTDSAFVQINPSEESYWKISFTQPLLKNILGGNDRGEITITKIDMDNFRNETLDSIEHSLSEVELAYWQLLLRERLVEIRNQMVQKAEEFYDIVAAKEEIGSAELSDLYAARANVKLRKSELRVEKAKLHAAQNKLKLLINNNAIGTNVYLRPTDTIEITEDEIPFISAVKEAFEGRRDYRRAMKDIEAKKIKVRMKANEMWPQLDLEGSFRMNGVRRSFWGSLEDTIEETNTEYYAGVTFSFPIEGRKAKSALEKAKYEKAKALLMLKRTEKEIVSEIDSNVKIVNAYRQRAEEYAKIADLQKLKLEEEQKKYRYGRSSSDLIIRFQEDYLNAVIARGDVLFAYAQALINLYLSQDTYLVKRDLTVQ